MTPNPNSFSFRVSQDPVSTQSEDWSVQVLTTSQLREEFLEDSIPLSTLDQILEDHFPAYDDGLICILSKGGRHQIRAISQVSLVEIQRSVVMGYDVYLVHLDPYEDQPEITVQSVTLITEEQKALSLTRDLGGDPLTRSAVRGELRGVVEPTITTWIARSNQQ